MSRDDALALVARQHIGRCGLALHDLIRVELTPYVYDQDWIHVRASVGGDLDVIRRHPWAAFEVDEVDGVLDWRSVEITGAVEVLTPGPDDDDDRFAFERTEQLLRATLPAILTADDPYPDRVHLLRIHVDTVRGRISRTVDGTAPEISA